MDRRTGRLSGRATGPGFRGTGGTHRRWRAHAAVDAPAGEEFTIAIQPANSSSAANPLWSQNYTLEGGEKYILIANGIVSATGYDPVQPFNIYVYPLDFRFEVVMFNQLNLLTHETL